MCGMMFFFPLQSFFFPIVTARLASAIMDLLVSQVNYATIASYHESTIDYFMHLRMIVGFFLPAVMP